MHQTKKIFSVGLCELSIILDLTYQVGYTVLIPFVNSEDSEDPVHWHS